ncbi:hypothetical protein Tco_0024425 [Tanacetum coccineum]
MEVIMGDFMQLYLEVTKWLKEKMKEDGSKMRKIEKITRYPDSKVPKPLTRHKFSENLAMKALPNTPKPIPTNSLYIEYVHPIFLNPPHFRKNTFGFNPGTQEENPPPLKKSHLKKRFRGSEYSKMACTKCTMMLLHDAPFISGTSLIRNSSLAKVYRELVRELFASFEFDASPCRYDPKHLGVKFRLGGEQMEISLLELGWRVGLYIERKSRENMTLNRDQKVKLAHRCIAMTISGRKESTNMVTEIDIYYLYCIYTQGVVGNIPYWLAKYIRSVREKNLIYGRVFMTRIA